MKIQNSEELGRTELRKIALKIAERGLEAIDTKSAIQESVRLDGDTLIVSSKKFSIAKSGKLIVIAVGKCAIDAACALEEIMEKKITGGIVLDVRENNAHAFPNIEYFAGSHPAPSDTNVEVAKKIVSLLSDLTVDDIVLFVISGGGSTLLCLPEEGVSCLDEKIILEELTASAVPIGEINIVRKHMSLARGGHLAKYAYPAKVISLIFSDVPGNDTSVIASGPTVKDETTIKDADEILLKYGILAKCGIEHCGLVETPKEDKYFENVYNAIIVSNEKALSAMRKEAEGLSFDVLVEDTSLNGEAREVGERIAHRIKETNPKTVLLYGGETTVVVKGKGRGGRNQELALSALHHINTGDSELVLSLASDGRDNGKYAGAIADSETRGKTESMNLDITEYLENNNATEFFEKIEDLIITGDTGSNVSDLIIAIKN